jgi:hypothetical protein
LTSLSHRDTASSSVSLDTQLQVSAAFSCNTRLASHTDASQKRKEEGKNDSTKQAILPHPSQGVHMALINGPD